MALQTWAPTSGFVNNNAALFGLASLWGRRNNQKNTKDIDWQGLINEISGTLPGLGAFGVLVGKGKSKGTDWQSLVNEIYGDISGYQNPYLAQLEPLVSQWLSPDYKAYSEQQLKDWYEQGKQQLEGDIFKQWDEGYGQSMAARGLAGSGVANINYGKILGQKGGALADLWSNLQKYAEEATRSDRALATSLVPTMTQLANLPMEQKMQLLNLLTSQYAAEQQRRGQSAAGWGSAIGSIIGAIPEILSILKI